jgi:hypothetical protein
MENPQNETERRMLTIEVLQYTLKPGTGAAFHTLMETQSIPLHQQCDVNVLKYGNSLHDTDKYYLVRSFRNISEMDKQLAHFYSNSRWKDGPRNAIVNLITDSHRVVMYGDHPFV